MELLFLIIEYQLLLYSKQDVMEKKYPSFNERP